jgi:glycosyltransferase involved in cell wall biosynthesis
VKTIALFDPFWSGHHPMYLKLFSEVVLSLGVEVMIFCANPKAMQELMSGSSARYGNMIQYFEIPAPRESSFPIHILRPALYGFKLWRSAEQAIRGAVSMARRSPDLVFFAWLDSYITHFQSRHIMDRLFPFNWSGLFFHPYHLRLRLKFSRLRHGPLDLNESLKSHRCKAVGVLDEGIAMKLQEELVDKPVVIFPDVTDKSVPDRSFPVAKDIASKAKGRKIITLIGSLDRRKGFLTLAEVAQRTASRDWFFVFAGKLAEKKFTPQELASLRKLTEAPPQNCFFYLETIPGESQYNALVEMSDILYAAYDNFLHSSNALTKAAVFERPVIVSKGYCMEERTKQYNLGTSIEYGDVMQCIEAIGLLLDGSPKNGAARNFAGYRLAHSRERLTSAFKSIIDCYESR